MYSKNEVASLLDALQTSEKANHAFDNLIDQLLALMQQAATYRTLKQFDPIAMYKYANSLECVIASSGHDERVIRMCGVMLDLTGVSEHEFKLEADGKVRKRQVYFAQRGDGLIKIGSTMKVAERMAQLSAGAAEELDLIGHIDGSTLFEKAIHKDLEKHRKYGEWFVPAPEVMVYINSFFAERAP